MEEYMIIKFNNQLYAVNIKHTSGILNSFECKNSDYAHPLSIGMIKTFNGSVPVFSIKYETKTILNTPQKILLLKLANQSLGVLITEEVDIEHLELLDEQIFPKYKEMSPDIFKGSVSYYTLKIPVVDVNKVFDNILSNDIRSKSLSNKDETSLVDVQPYLETLNHNDLMTITYKLIESSRSGMLLMKPNHEVLFINESLKLQFNENMNLNQQRFGNIFGCLTVLKKGLQCGEQSECDTCTIKSKLLDSFESQLNIKDTSIRKPLLNNTLQKINISIHPIIIQQEKLLWVTFNT